LAPLRHVPLVAALLSSAACSSVPRKANPEIVTLGPEYLPSAAERRIEGDVRIEFHIAKDTSLPLPLPLSDRAESAA
jgi:hypothetical protein